MSPFYIFHTINVLTCLKPGSESASSGTSIIGENMGVFIGGLSEDFTLLRKDSG